MKNLQFNLVFVWSTFSTKDMELLTVPTNFRCLPKSSNKIPDVSGVALHQWIIRCQNCSYCCCCRCCCCISLNYHRSSHLFPCNVITRQFNQFSKFPSLCKVFSVKQWEQHPFLLSLAVFTSPLQHYFEFHVSVCAVKNCAHFMQLIIIRHWTKEETV